MNIYENKSYPVTKGRLNKMCKYFKNKKVNISYEYNNSLGYHSIVEIVDKYDSFKIEWEECIYGCHSAEIRFFKKDKIIFTFGIDSAFGADFVGLGKIDISNSGPYCYFRINKMFDLFDNIKNFWDKNANK